MSSTDDLFAAVKAVVPPFFGAESWYLIAASTLVACGKPEELSSLYLYATGPNSPLTDSEKSNVPKRLQDVLAKEWTLVGIPLVVIASATLAKVEKEDVTTTWQAPELTPETTARGTALLEKIYKENLDPIFASLGFNQPLVEYIDRALVYGLFLSDHRVLSELETSLVCVASIMSQGLRAPTSWHLRGLRRLGASEEDAKAVERAIKSVAEWTGKNTDEWATVEDVRDEI